MSVIKYVCNYVLYSLNVIEEKFVIFLWDDFFKYRQNRKN